MAMSTPEKRNDGRCDIAGPHSTLSCGFDYDGTWVGDHMTVTHAVPAAPSPGEALLDRDALVETFGFVLDDYLDYIEGLQHRAPDAYAERIERVRLLRDWMHPDDFTPPAPSPGEALRQQNPVDDVYASGGQVQPMSDPYRGGKGGAAPIAQRAPSPGGDAEALDVIAEKFDTWRDEDTAYAPSSEFADSVLAALRAAGFVVSRETQR